MCGKLKPKTITNLTYSSWEGGKKLYFTVGLMRFSLAV